MWKFAILSAGFTLALAAGLNATEQQRVQLLEDYKSTFANYLSLERTQNPDQIIRLFANDIAAKGPGAEQQCM